MAEETPQETPVTPPDTGAPGTTQTPENPSPQEPNVSPNPAPPSNPTTSPSNPPANPDLLTELRALPERLANVLNERNPSATQPQTPAQTQTQTESGPGGKGDAWETRFARMWFGG
jgi:hypothetical protein